MTSSEVNVNWIDHLETVANLVESAATLAVLAAGAYWFRRRRENHPRVDFDAALDFLGTNNDRWLVAVVATVENRGAVRHRIDEFGFEIRCLRSFELVRRGQTADGQVDLREVLKSGSWLQGHEYTFVDPHTKAVYRYLTELPRNAAIVMLRGRFRYPPTRWRRNDEVFESTRFYRVRWKTDEQPLSLQDLDVRLKNIEEAIIA